MSSLFLALLTGVILLPSRTFAGHGASELRFHSVLPRGFYLAQILLVDNVNADASMLPGATVKIYFGDSLKSKPKAIELGSAAMENKTHGVIGDFNSGTSEPLAYVLQEEGTLLCSGASTATEFSDKSDFPNFWRTISADDGAGSVIMDWVASMGWNKVNVLASNTAYGQGVADSAVARAASLNISVAIRQGFTSSSIIDVGGPLDYSDVLQNIMSTKVRIIVFAGAYDEMIPMYLQAHAMGLVGAGYVWITGESSKFINGYVGDNYPQYLPLLRGLIVVYPREIQGDMGAQFVANYTALYGGPPDDYSGFYFDCLWGTILAYQALLSSHTIQDIGIALLVVWVDIHFGANAPWKAMQTFALPAMEQFIPRSYTGVTGRVSLDNSSDREAPYNIFNLQNPAVHNVYTTIGYSDQDEKVYSVVEPVFFDGTSVVPPDFPPLVTADVDPDSALVYSAFVLSGLAIIVIFVSMVIV
ncbi:hypothetical protein HKX48_004639, partial [Thoreauomyces humboldtii]